MNLTEGLGYNYLSNQEKELYKVVLKALSLNMNSFNYAVTNRDVDIMKIILTVLGDNPLIINFNKTKIEIEELNEFKKVLLSGIPSQSQMQKMYLALNFEVNRIISQITATTASDEYALLIKLYEYLQENVNYDKQEYIANLKGVCTNQNAHNAYGALINKYAVCDGYSSAFALLAKKLGFDCMIVIGMSSYESSSVINHAWNIVKIQNKYYHMDNTWDSKRFNEFNYHSYAYFALNDEEIKVDHMWDRNSTPACKNDDLSFYKRNSLFADNMEQAKNIIAFASKKNTGILRMKLSPRIILKENTGEELVQMYMESIAKTGIRIQFNYTWNEKTRCLFAKII